MILLSIELKAQVEYDYQILSVNQGLSQGMVFDALQCKDGYIWIATKGGLNRYNGYNFDVFSPDAFDPFALGASEIRKLFEDSKGRIWINHLEGIDVFIPGEGLFFHLPKPDLPIFIGWENDSSPLSFAETPDGSIWIADMEHLWRIQLSDEALQLSKKRGNAFPEYSLRKISFYQFKDSDGTFFKVKNIFFSEHYGLLAGTNNGLYHLDYKTEAFAPLTLQGYSVKIAGEESSGLLWLRVWKKNEDEGPQNLIPKVDDFEGENQIAFYDGNQVQFLKKTIGHTHLFYPRSNGNMWFLQGNVLQKWKSENLREEEAHDLHWAFKEPFLQPDDFIFKSLMIDESGLLWMGTRGYGMVKFNPEKPKFSSFLPNRTQRSIIEDPKGRLFTYMDPQYIFKDLEFEDREQNPWYISQPDIYYPTVFDEFGNGWGNNEFGTLFRIDKITKELQLFPWKGYGLIFSRKGYLISVHETGLIKFDPTSEKSTLFPFSESVDESSRKSYIRHLHESKDGTIWIFTFEGIVRAVPGEDGFDFTHFRNIKTDRNSLSTNKVFSVADDPIDPDRYLWIGTNGGGLNRLDKESGTFKHFNTANGLPDNVIYGILPDENGHIWLSTNRGLCRFHVREESAKNFVVADGLQYNEFNRGSYLRTSDGFMIFGGVNGLTVFHPDKLQFNSNIPGTRIVGLSIGNEARSITPPAHLRLSHRQNFLSFEFAALDFTNPSQNRFRYKLEKTNRFGRSESEYWIESGHKNTVQFANLQPGRYTFKVMGSNNDGVWSEQPAKISFSISPPWWASSFAYFLYFLLFGSVIFTLYRFQLRRNFDKQEALRLRELDEFKNQFFTNITHEFRTPLTVILGTSERLTAQVNGNKIQEDRPQLERMVKLIQRNGKNLLNLINQILDLAKLESQSNNLNYIQGDVLGYLRYILESLKSMAETRNIELSMKSHQAGILMDYDPDRLLQIVYNLLSNAVKFTPEGGRVTMEVTTDGKALCISVVDTGVGIPEESIPFVFDRFFQVKNHNGNKATSQINISGGSGIGLSITRNLVEAMGGTISLKSPLPDGTQGTEFTVRLPITNDSPMADSESAATLDLPYPLFLENAEKKPDESLPSILIVEDNLDVSEFLGAGLSSNYNLDFAFDGKRGIELAIQNLPDLIISDVMMPEADGFELCDQLKNDERTSHIPIILLTAKADVDSRVAGLRRGADAYLAKPFHEEELTEWIKQLIAGRKLLQERYSNLSNVSDSETEEGKNHEFAIEDVFVQKFKSLLERNFSDSNFSVDFVCSELNMSRSQLYRKLNALTGKTVIDHLKELRLESAKKLLESGKWNVSEAAYKVGYNDPKYFGKLFLAKYGEPPSNFSSNQ